MKKPTSPLIPVLDLMIGQIVLATGGDRSQYRPVHSKLTHSSAPIDVARAMFLQTGCDCLYLADIDSFAGAEPNWSVYNELLDAGFGVWIDANWSEGRRSVEIAERIESRDRLKVILSSETMSTTAEFSQLSDLIASGVTPIFSLDRKGESLITQPGELAGVSPLELVQQAYEKGVRDLIVLDLDAVGTMQGFGDEESATHSLIQEISHELSDLCLISGGGVRSADDVQRLLDTGCQHVLAASAIHECRFTPDDVTGLKPFGPETRRPAI